MSTPFTHTKANPMTSATIETTIQNLSHRSWKRLATLDDQDDAEQLRDLLVSVLEALDVMTDQTEAK